MLGRPETELGNTLWGLGPYCEGTVMRCLSLEEKGRVLYIFDFPLAVQGSSACPHPKQTAQSKGHHMCRTGWGLLSHMVLNLSDKLQKLWIGVISILKYSANLSEIFPLILPTRSTEVKADVTNRDKKPLNDSTVHLVCLRTWSSPGTKSLNNNFPHPACWAWEKKVQSGNLTEWM